jgi:hypothetical protein
MIHSGHHSRLQADVHHGVIETFNVQKCRLKADSLKFPLSSAATSCHLLGNWDLILPSMPWIMEIMKDPPGSIAACGSVIFLLPLLPTCFLDFL